MVAGRLVAAHFRGLLRIFAEHQRPRGSAETAPGAVPFSCSARDLDHLAEIDRRLRSSATIVGYAFQCFALVQQEGARLPRGFPMWSLTRICCCFLWLIILLVESKLNWNWKWSLTRVMQSLTSTTLLEFHCYVG